MDIGTLTGAIAIEDQFSETFSLAIDKVKELSSHLAEELGPEAEVAATAVGMVVAAVGALTGAIVALGIQGSTVQGVEESFDRLAEKAGTTGEALRGSLSEGLHGTVDEMAEMKATTNLLGSGMELSTDEAKLLGTAARDLGKATGGDATSGLEMLSQALTTGRVRQLQHYTGLIDLKKGEEDYAASLGLSVSQLDEEGKIEGKRGAILEAVKGYVDRLGESQDTFKEKLEQGKVGIENWVDSLAKSVSESPEVIGFMNAIQQAFHDAFGDGAQLSDILVQTIRQIASALTTVVNWIDNAVIAWKAWGPSLATMAQIAGAITGITIDTQALTASTEKHTQSVSAEASATTSAATATDRHSAASAAARMAQDAYDKAVQTHVDSMTKAASETNLTTDAFNALSLSQRLNVEVQAQLIPQLDKIIASGRDLTTSEKAYYELVTNGKIMMQANNEIRLQTLKVQLDQIDALKAEGMSQAAIAEKYGVTVTALTAYENALKETKKVTQELADAEDEYSGHTADIAVRNRKIAMQAALDSFTGTLQGRKDLEDKLKALDDLRVVTESASWKAIENASISSQQEILQENIRTLQHMESSGNFFRADIDKQKAKVQELTDKIHNQGEEVSKTGQIQAAVAQNSIDWIDKEIAAQDELDKKLSYSTTYDLSTRGGIGAFLQGTTGATLHASVDDIMALAKAGITLQQMIENGIIEVPNQKATGHETVSELLANKGAGGGSSGGGGPSSANSVGPSPTVVTSGGGAAAATGGGVSGAPTINAPVNITGVWDLNAKQQIHDLVAQAITKALASQITMPRNGW